MIIPDIFLSVHEELVLFLLSVIMGCGLGALFDIFRAFRIIIPHRTAAAAVEDILFCVIWAFSLVCFTNVYAKGQFRMFFIAGNIPGFILWRVTVGNPLARLLSRVIDVIFRILRKVFSVPAKLISRIYRKYRRKFVKNAKIHKSRKNIWSAPLIDKGKMLYNIYNKKRSGKGESRNGSE